MFCELRFAILYSMEKTHKVIAIDDNGNVVAEFTDSYGSHEDCTSFIREMPKRIWNKFNKDGMSISIIDLATNRHCSYVC